MSNPPLNKPMVILGAIGTVFIVWAMAGFAFTLLLQHVALVVPPWLNFLPMRYVIIPLFTESNANLGLIAIGVCFWGVAFAVRPQTIRESFDEGANENNGHDS